MAQFSTIEVLVAVLMTRWEFRIVPCLSGGNASATCLKILVMRFADVQKPAPLSLLLHFAAQYKFTVIIILIIPILQELHWLPYSHRITFKIRLTTYRCLQRLAPDYFRSVCI